MVLGEFRAPSNLHVVLVSPPFEAILKLYYDDTDIVVLSEFAF